MQQSLIQVERAQVENKDSERSVQCQETEPIYAEVKACGSNANLVI